MTYGLLQPLAASALAQPTPLVASKRKRAQWTFGAKLKRWLVDAGTNVNAFAERLGIPQSSLQRYVNGTKIPPDRLRSIALATRIPADYWLNDDLPYPPPVEYLNLEEEALAAMKSLTTEQLAELLDVLRDPEDLRRTLAMRRAARS